MQHNQLLTKSHVELEDNSIISAFEDVQSCGILLGFSLGFLMGDIFALQFAAVDA